MKSRHYDFVLSYAIIELAIGSCQFCPRSAGFSVCRSAGQNSC